ncbi:unnamed protein product [Aphanomyces euteiches]
MWRGGLSKLQQEMDNHIDGHERFATYLYKLFISIVHSNGKQKAHEHNHHRVMQPSVSGLSGLRTLHCQR